mmetsp:Transcript_14220/g.53403  ORF Transcript_14220/g.53403 Transcript_14220/m.53403 type:complete len:896 (+) Transcript_14220:3039-5726(+)
MEHLGELLLLRTGEVVQHGRASDHQLGGVDLDRLALGLEGADADAVPERAKLPSIPRLAHQVGAHLRGVIKGTPAHHGVRNSADASRHDDVDRVERPGVTDGHARRHEMLHEATKCQHELHLRIVQDVGVPDARKGGQLLDNLLPRGKVQAVGVVLVLALQLFHLVAFLVVAVFVAFLGIRLLLQGASLRLADEGLVLGLLLAVAILVGPLVLDVGRLLRVRKLPPDLHEPSMELRSLHLRRALEDGSFAVLHEPLAGGPSGTGLPRFLLLGLLRLLRLVFGCRCFRFRLALGAFLSPLVGAFLSPLVGAILGRRSGGGPGFARGGRVPLLASLGPAGLQRIPARLLPLGFHLPLGSLSQSALLRHLPRDPNVPPLRPLGSVDASFSDVRGGGTRSGKRNHLREDVLNEVQNQELVALDAVRLVVEESTEAIADANGVDRLRARCGTLRNLHDVDGHILLKGDRLPGVRYGLLDVPDHVVHELDPGLLDALGAIFRTVREVQGRRHFRLSVSGGLQGGVHVLDQSVHLGQGIHRVRLHGLRLFDRRLVRGRRRVRGRLVLEGRLLALAGREALGGELQGVRGLLGEIGQLDHRAAQLTEGEVAHPDAVLIGQDELEIVLDHLHHLGVHRELELVAMELHEAPLAHHVVHRLEDAAHVGRPRHLGAAPVAALRRVVAHGAALVRRLQLHLHRLRRQRLPREVHRLVAASVRQLGLDQGGLERLAREEGKEHVVELVNVAQVVPDGHVVQGHPEDVVEHVLLGHAGEDHACPEEQVRRVHRRRHGVVAEPLVRVRLDHDDVKGAFRDAVKDDEQLTVAHDDRQQQALAGEHVLKQLPRLPEEGHELPVGSRLEQPQHLLEDGRRLVHDVRHVRHGAALLDGHVAQEDLLTLEGTLRR